MNVGQGALRSRLCNFPGLNKEKERETGKYTPTPLPHPLSGYLRCSRIQTFWSQCETPFPTHKPVSQETVYVWDFFVLKFKPKASCCSTGSLMLRVYSVWDQQFYKMTITSCSSYWNFGTKLQTAVLKCDSSNFMTFSQHYLVKLQKKISLSW